MKSKSIRSKIKIILILLVLIAVHSKSTYAETQQWTRLTGHIPSLESNATPISQVANNSPIQLAVTLPLRNEGELDVLIKRMYTPGDPIFGKYLSTNEFVTRYSPTLSDYSRVVDYLASMGLKVTNTSPNRLYVGVEGSSSQISRAFGIRLLNYQTSDGLLFRAPDANPVIDTRIRDQVSAIVGLDNLTNCHPHAKQLPPLLARAILPWQVGTGVGGGLTPTDIKKAYAIAGLTIKGQTTPLNGKGQSVALFELDGYNSSDITKYAQANGLPQPTLQNVLVNGYSGSAGGNAAEVVLDIELVMAIAPNIDKIYVYEAPNNGAGIIANYNKIASDNIAKQVSTSWGLSETSSNNAVCAGENSAFKQMAAQGQSIFAASGDAGAYDNRVSLSVDDPASQPYITGVGGTQLFLNGSGGTYKRETTWNNGSANSGAGGGGVSARWTKPDWQAGAGISSTMRNVPDVSLNSDPYTGYAIYFSGRWTLYGGTSCAAPLWAGFCALVNQQRAALKKASIGFINPIIYKIGASSRYANDFHDIADGSTNLYYPTITGYDNATGWGSFIGSGLLYDLAEANSIPVTQLSIINGPTASPAKANASINWSTSIAGSTTVYYGTTPAGLNRVISNTSQVTGHTVTINGLLRHRTYYYVVMSSTSSEVIKSTVKSFITL